MKRHTFTVVGLVLFALSTLGAATAPAAEWLINGTPVASPTAIEMTGPFRLNDTKAGLKVECEATANGTVTAKGEGETTAFLEGGTASSLTKPLKCKPQSSCEAPAEAVVETLPWHQRLVSGGGGFSYMAERITYWASCHILGLIATDECAFLSIPLPIVNAATDVEVPSGTSTELVSCTVGGMGSGRLEFPSGLLIAAPAGALQAA